MAQKFRHVHRRGVQRQIPLQLAAAFHPVNMVVRRLAQKFRDLLPQFAQPPVALDQLLSDVLVVARLDEFADGLAQPLDRQRDIVRHQFRVADAQFLPFAPALRTAFAAGKIRFRLRLDGLARGFDVLKKLVRLAQNFRNQLHGLALAQRGEQPLFRLRIPQPVQRIAHLSARHAQADVPRRHALHRVRLVENHKVVLE